MKASELVAWLKKEFDLGQGHSMAIWAVFKDKALSEEEVICSLESGRRVTAKAPTYPGLYSARLRGSSYRRLLIARELLQERYRGPLPLRDLAAAAGLSEFHLLRAYRAAFGETPHQHLTRLRLEHAKRALARGATVTEVCFDVGYSSLGSFSSLFTRATGRSPRAWQRDVRALVSVPADLPRLYIPGCFLAFFVDPAPRLP